MIVKDIKYTYNDVAIMPSATSNISHRSECDVFYYDKMLPLFTAPMDTVVGCDNVSLFKKNNINPILPRTIPVEIRLENCKTTWAAFSLSEFESYFCDNLLTNFNYKQKHYVLVDIANGHMRKLHGLVSRAKYNHRDNIVIMAGNVANPLGYKALCEAGADYVRVGIGAGHGCLTTSNTGVHYPMISLINDCLEEQKRIPKNMRAKIIADGGIRGYSDIIKALAAGADYVMCGSIFNRMLESSAPTKPIRLNSTKLTDDLILNNGFVNQFDKSIKDEFNNGLLLEKEFYGMSTKTAQKKMGCEKLKTSEGLVRTQQVEYTIEGWRENFIDYLRSAMSYTDSSNLIEFTSGKVILNVISENTYSSVNK